jgi:hypothetical protein
MVCDERHPLGMLTILPTDRERALYSQAAAAYHKKNVHPPEKRKRPLGTDDIPKKSNTSGFYRLSNCPSAHSNSIP